jgi:DHA2 family methylenomycin A resistance protein-like MFS transporter
VRLAVLVVGQVLSVANANMIAVALPPLSRDLGASGTQQQWVVDAFVLVFAALLIAGGVLGDRHGRRRAFVAGLGVFAVGSLACALAASPGPLIAARVVQGLGPPLILPGSLALVAVAYPDRRERARAIGFWGAGSGIGAALGPLLGGLIVAGLGWRWVFALNVPVALGLIAAALAVIERDSGHRGAHRFDLAGALLVTAGLAGVVFGIIEGRERGWTSPPVIAGFAAGLVLLAAFVAAERRHPEPLVDLALLGRRTFAGANVGGATMMFTLIGTTVYVSAFLQTTRDLTALETGLALLPLGGAVAACAPISGRLTAHVAPRALIVGGILCAAAGAALLGRTDASAAVSAAPAHETGMASAIHNASRQLGGALGVAVLGTIVLSGTSLTAGLRAALTTAAVLLVAVAALSAGLLAEARG